MNKTTIAIATGLFALSAMSPLAALANPTPEHEEHDDGHHEGKEGEHHDGEHHDGEHHDEKGDHHEEPKPHG